VLQIYSKKRFLSYKRQKSMVTKVTGI